MPFTQPWFEVDFGSAYAGIGTTGYRLYKNDGTDSVARTATGVVDLGNGGYGVPLVSVPDNAVGIQWDTGGGSPVYAIEDIEPYRDRMNLDALVSSRAVPGAEMNLADDAITSAKYDESSAFPLKADDSGATEVARTGADGDTLETISDQIDGVAAPGSEMNLVDDAITLAKFDETTAWPLEASDTGVTEVARTGADGDTLETLSDQLDGVQTDLNDPSQYQADVSALALEANVEGHATAALAAYDPPTRAEATADKNEIIVEVNANEVKIDGIPVAVDAVLTASHGSGAWNSEEYELWSSMADDQTNAKMAFWIERYGQRKTNVTSMTVTIRKCSDGSVVHTFPPNTSPDARGVFYFTTPVTGFPYNDPLYADVEATDGATTWYNNFGMTRV